MTAVARDPERAPGDAVVVHRSQSGWDELVAAIGGQPFQAWAWGELKSAFGWRPHRLATAGGDAAAQLLIRPYRGLAVAYVPRGPILSDTANDESLLASIVSHARAQRAAFVRVEPDVLEDDPRAERLLKLLREAGFRASDRTLQPRSSIRLNLEPDEDQLFASFSKGHRADIRRAERDGVQVRAGLPADAEILHRMLVATSERKHFGFHSAGYYRLLLEAFGDAAHIQIAELAGEPIGASIVLAWGLHGTYLAAGSTEIGLRHHAAHLLQWYAIRWAKARGVRDWDLWGIADARGRHALAVMSGSATNAQLIALDAEARADPVDGVFRFKKGWGGQVVRTLPAFDRVFIAPAYWYWQWRRGGG